MRAHWRSLLDEFRDEVLGIRLGTLDPTALLRQQRAAHRARRVLGASFLLLLLVELVAVPAILHTDPRAVIFAFLGSEQALDALLATNTSVAASGVLLVAILAPVAVLLFALLVAAQRASATLEFWWRHGLPRRAKHAPAWTLHSPGGPGRRARFYAHRRLDATEREAANALAEEFDGDLELLVAVSRAL